MQQYNAEAYCNPLSNLTESLILFLWDSDQNFYLPCAIQGDTLSVVTVTFDENQKIATAAVENLSPVDGIAFLEGENAEAIEFSEIALNDFDVSSCVDETVNEY